MDFEVWPRIISAAVVPAVLISACGLLCLAFYNRLGVVLARLRGLGDESLKSQEGLVAAPGAGGAGGGKGDAFLLSLRDRLPRAVLARGGAGRALAARAGRLGRALRRGPDGRDGRRPLRHARAVRRLPPDRDAPRIRGAARGGPAPAPTIPPP